MNELDLLTGAGFWTTRASAALGLRSLVLSDGPVGVRGERWDERGSAVLPSPTAWAASWDESLATALGGLLADEARRKGVDVLLGELLHEARQLAPVEHDRDDTDQDTDWEMSCGQSRKHHVLREFWPWRPNPA